MKTLALFFTIVCFAFTTSVSAQTTTTISKQTEKATVTKTETATPATTVQTNQAAATQDVTPMDETMKKHIAEVEELERKVNANRNNPGFDAARADEEVRQLKKAYGIK